MPSSSDSADRRHAHQPLDLAAIAPFLAGREVLSSALLVEGRSNSNYKLTLDDGLHCIVRVHARPTAALERYVAELVRGRVPAPGLLFSARDVTVWEFVPGRPLQDDPTEVRLAAATLAGIWETKFESEGELRPGGGIEPWPFGDSQGFAKTMLGHPSVRRQLGPELFQGVVHLLERERHRSEKPAVAHLVHGDFNPTNALIHEGRVSAVIDWEFAHSGGPSGGVDLGSHLEFLTSARSETFKATRIELVRELLEMDG